MKKSNGMQYLLIILFIVYLVMDIRFTDEFKKYLDNYFAKFIIVILTLFLFTYNIKNNPILGILGIFVSYQILKQLNVNILNKDIIDNETKKWSPYKLNNRFSYTLEQEIVSKMTNQKYNLTPDNSSSYKPVLEKIYNASPI